VTTNQPNESPETAKTNALIVIALLGIACIIFIYLLAANSTFDIKKPNEKQATSTTECTLSPDNLCDGKVIELIGTVNAAQITESLGYRFYPENTRVSNPIYLTAIRYEGTDTYTGEEKKEYIQIPFGTKIKVRGLMITREVAWCTQRDYAKAHPSNCPAGRAAIALSPYSIISAKPVTEDRYQYFINGSFKEFQNTITSCPEKGTVCEGYGKDNCITVALQKRYCEHMVNKPNNITITGSTKSFAEPVSPTEITAITSTSYESTEYNEKRANRSERYSFNDMSKIAVYDQTGDRIALLNTGEKYYSLGQISATKQGIYFFTANTLKFKKLGTEAETEAEVIGTVDPSLVPQKQDITNSIIAPDGKSLVTLVSSSISETPLTGTSYMVRKNKYTLIEIPLEKSENKNLQHTVLFEKEIDGFISLSKYNFTTGEAVLDYAYDKDQPNPCIKTNLFLINTKTSAERQIYTQTTDARRNCNDVVSHILYLSDDLHTLITASDLNENLEGPLPKKLNVYKIAPDNTITTKEIIASAELLSSAKLENIRFTSLNGSLLSFSSLSLPELSYTFDLTKNEFSLKTIVPKYKNKDMRPLDGIDYRNTIRTVVDDTTTIYILTRAVVDYELYAINKKDNTLYLIATFSGIARAEVVNNNLYIYDTNSK
jgi:hypothetical protein